MPTLLDRVIDPRPTFCSTLERTADDRLEWLRSLGIGRRFVVLKGEERGSVVDVSRHYSTAMKVVSAVLLPLTLLQAALALILKQVAVWASPGLAEKYKFAQLHYPVARKGTHVDTYHGVKVPCPYRWLEDDKSSETQKWIDAQVELTKSYLGALSHRKEIRERLEELWDFERYGTPIKKGDRYFWSHNTGLQNQSVIYWSRTPEGKKHVLLDPNKLSEDGTTSLQESALSYDGHWFAYAISEGGSDWRKIRIRDVETKLEAYEELQWVKFTSISWRKDGEGFFYSRYPAPEVGKELTGEAEYHKLYYHKLGTEQDKDIVVYEEPDHPDHLFEGKVTPDGKYLIIYVEKGCDRDICVKVKNLEDPVEEVKTVFGNWDASYSYVFNVGSHFWFKTDKDAPFSRLIQVDIQDPRPETWKEVLAEADDCLEKVAVHADHLVAVYRKDAHSVVKVFDPHGKELRELKLPGMGQVSGFRGKNEDSETFFSFRSFSTPGRVYRYDVVTDKMWVWRSPKVDFDPDAFVTQQVFIPGEGRRPMPMFITHRKDLEIDGTQSTLLYAYGGFKISIPPFFKVSNLAWMEQGGILAVPNLRGGGEYGREWHQGGMKLNKQNVFDDMAAAAEYLIEKGYTKPEHLAIEGGSNGGLLVGAMLNQRPDLFGAGVAHVGVMDMLRFNKFTIGKAWESDYGSPEDPEEFKALYAYSPLHNVKKETTYPPALVTTSDHDDRVVPLHSFKYTAALQDVEPFNLERPHLIRIARKTGHGAGRSTEQQIEEAVDRNVFLTTHLT